MFENIQNLKFSIFQNFGPRFLTYLTTLWAPLGIGPILDLCLGASRNLTLAKSRSSEKHFFTQIFFLTKLRCSSRDYKEQKCVMRSCLLGGPPEKKIFFVTKWPKAWLSFKILLTYEEGKDITSLLNNPPSNGFPLKWKSWREP